MLQNLCDVHTHTLFSRHAYSTIAENVREASEVGLELIGSADHFGDMLFTERDVRNFQYFLNTRIWPRTWDGVRVMHGCEADIVNLDGKLFGWDEPASRSIVHHRLEDDCLLQDRVFAHCDYVVASIHYKGFCHGASLAETTAMYVQALEHPKVLVLGHPGRAGVPFDLDEVLLAAKDMGKLIEINEHSFVMGGMNGKRPAAYEPCKRIAQRCAELGVQVAVSTDAHICTQVGRFDQALGLLEEIDFPQELIATRDAEAFLAVARDAVGFEADF